jgi:hypothetical protein
MAHTLMKILKKQQKPQPKAVPLGKKDKTVPNPKHKSDFEGLLDLASRGVK